MSKALISIIIAGTLVLLVSLGLLYASVFLFASLIEEYFEPVFRSSSFSTDWLFYVHPYVVSAALYWFWSQFSDRFEGSAMVKAIRVALAYALVALLPVLWLTFSAINISAMMVITWVFYGFVQAFVACIVFSRRTA